MCEEKIPPHADFPQSLRNKFGKWVSNISKSKLKILRSALERQEVLTTTDMLVPGNDEIVASCIVIYGRFSQSTVIIECVVVNKSCLSKQNLFVLRLNIALVDMPSNLFKNVKSAIKDKTSIRFEIWCKDSTVVLNYLNRK